MIGLMEPLTSGLKRVPGTCQITLFTPLSLVAFSAWFDVLILDPSGSSGFGAKIAPYTVQDELVDAVTKSGLTLIFRLCKAITLALPRSLPGPSLHLGREPQGNRGEEEDNCDNGPIHNKVWNGGMDNISHAYIGRRDPFNGEEEHPKGRRQCCSAQVE
jgi:hypothetical protein